MPASNPTAVISHSRDISRKPESLPGMNGEFFRFTIDIPGHGFIEEASDLLASWGIQISWPIPEQVPQMEPDITNLVHKQRGANIRFYLYLPAAVIQQEKIDLVKVSCEIKSAPKSMNLPSNTILCTIVFDVVLDFEPGDKPFFID